MNDGIRTIPQLSVLLSALGLAAARPCNGLSQFSLLNLNQIHILFQNYQESMNARFQPQTIWIDRDELFSLGLWLALENPPRSIALLQKRKRPHSELWLEYGFLRMMLGWPGLGFLRRGSALMFLRYWYHLDQVYRICLSPLWIAGPMMLQSMSGSLRKKPFLW